MNRQTESGLAIGEQTLDFLEDIAQEQHQGKNKDRHPQGRQDLAGEIEVQRFHNGSRMQKVERKSEKGANARS